MNINWKAAWAWFCGIAAGPMAIFIPHITMWDWRFTDMEKGAIVLSILGGLGLVNMKAPKDHQ